jgi:hypothetical protein
LAGSSGLRVDDLPFGPVGDPDLPNAFKTDKGGWRWNRLPFRGVSLEALLVGLPSVTSRKSDPRFEDREIPKVVFGNAHGFNRHHLLRLRRKWRRFRSIEALDEQCDTARKCSDNHYCN